MKRTENVQQSKIWQDVAIKNKQSVEKIQRIKLEIKNNEEEDKVTVLKRMKKTGLFRGFFYKNLEL